MLNRPNSGLVSQMDYYIAPVDEETDFLEISQPEELKIIDPACGSGHMLTYAFDLLYAIYEEEGYAPAEIPGLILTHNLYGSEIDPRAGALAAFALTMKARARQRTFFNKQLEPNICVIEPISFSPDELDFLVTKDGDKHAEVAFWNQFAEADTLGSLVQPDPTLTARLDQHLQTLDDAGDMLLADVIKWAGLVVEQATYLTPRYSVVIANPPYMGTRNMSGELRRFAEDAYTHYSGDLCTMFIDRSLELVVPQGLAALVVSESWMFNATYEGMRRDLVRRARPIVTACIDKSAFGVRLNTAASVFEQGTHRNRLSFFRISQDDLASGGIAAVPPREGSIHVIDVHHLDKVPGEAFLFDMPGPLLALYDKTTTLGDKFEVKQGLATADNGQFVRFWWEVSRDRFATGCSNRTEASQTGRRWFPYNKGGTPVPWWGNQDHVVNWESDGQAIRSFGTKGGGRPRSAVRNPDFYFRSAVTWSNIGSGGARFRLIPSGFVFDVAGMSAFASTPEEQLGLLGYLNSSIVRAGLDVLAPTFNYQVGDVARLPAVLGEGDSERVERLVGLTRAAWSESETAHEFTTTPLVGSDQPNLRLAKAAVSRERSKRAAQIGHLERLSDEYWATRIAELSDESMGEAFAHTPRTIDQPTDLADAQALASFAIGCMFGRYSLDQPGLILADQGATLEDYLEKVPSPAFMPDADNVIPIVDGDWFEDDVVERFRQFLRAAFGEQHYEENLRFVTDSLGVKNLRDYFVKSFYKDHVQRYKKRPIYWLFSSPKGSFNALIYMHRYTPSTVSTVLNEYLREFQAKLKASLDHAERSNNANEADRLRKVLLELDEYEHDVLYPLASQNIAIDLDDGVKTNYSKFGPALKKIPGLEAAE
ncbi:BREX-1 system adenine-specific DNA-methyltransferase PglX [Janibacter hoylei]|uniref:BREX-1 system adenine-specific DNA-methyltransferase PglX n=1 Tax=Janibacter hoylei TaxID=364298 RepID=UPI0022388D0E|nr:BREX-1 system adenine-specific DNA-methyltransferase PglX [Janibacter hoylei]MCW4602946.1 BREX-1 system adenine-specific DNA-methyltransferase PglX [Janibacter hoylei]